MYDLAREHFTCATCGEYTIEKFHTKYIECCSCLNQYHGGCVSVDVSAVHDVDAWICNVCIEK